MKKNNSLTLDFFYRFVSHSSIGDVFICLSLILILFPSCAGKMSVEEARQVTVSISGKSLVAPPRRIDDILTAIDHSGQYDPARGEKFRAVIDKPRPQTDNNATLANYYHRKGDATIAIGRHSQALADLHLAFDYSLRSGGPNHKLLNSLATAEFVSGNFKDAIELFEQSLSKKELPNTYNMLVKLYARVGDLESAEKAKKRGVGLCNRLRNQKGWGTWPNIMVANMEAYVLEAQGKFSEAEPHYRRALRNFTRSMRRRNSLSYIVYSVYLTRNLKNQDRLVEAEVEARETLNEALGISGRNAEVTATIIGELGEILLRQGRLEDAEKLMRAALRTLEETNVSSDHGLMVEGRMRLGEVLSAEQKFDEAMEQFDLAKAEMQQNRYLYKSYLNVTKNAAFMLSLLRTGRIEEAAHQISAIHARNSKLLGEKHYLTAETLGFRGMVYAMQKNDSEALRDFSDALPVLLETSSGDIFSYGRKIRLRIISETYLSLLARVKGGELEKEAGIDASSEAFKLADVLRGSTVRSAISASTARAAVTSPELADLVRREQDAQKQLKILGRALTDNLAAPSKQQLPELIKELKRKMDALTNARMVLVDEIKTRFPKYSELTTPKPVTISQLQNHLRPREAFISIYTADDQSYIWAIPHAGEVSFSTVSLGRTRLSQIVTDLRKALDPEPIALGDVPEFDISKAYGLYSKLLEPIEKGWKSATDLLIVAHGPLGQLPFSILPTAPVSLTEGEQELFSKYRKVPWLIRKASVTRLPSASSFITLRILPEGEPYRKAFAGFGDPLFNQEQLAQAEKEKEKPAIVLASRGGGFQVRGIRISEEGILDDEEIVSCTINNLNRLPDTSEEIKDIAEALGADPDRDIFLGKQASEHQVNGLI